MLYRPNAAIGTDRNLFLGDDSLYVIDYYSERYIFLPSNCDKVWLFTGGESKKGYRHYHEDKA